MNAHDLKNPGFDQLGQTTRMNVAKLLSNVQNETNPSGEVAAFLLDAASKAPGYTAPPEVLPPTTAKVTNGQSVPVHNSAGTNQAANGTLTVAASAVTKLTLPATVAVVKSGTQTINGKSVTFTVAAGVITDVVVA